MSSGAPKRLRLLVTSAGRRVELINAFRQSAQALDIGLDIFACDRAPAISAACHSADTGFEVPPVASDAYIPALLAAVAAHGIDLVVPTIDPELLPLAKASEQFAAAGATLAISSPELVAMAGDKLATAAFLAAHAIASPATATMEAALASPRDWPGGVFVKPQFGSAGRGTRAVPALALLDGVAADEPMLVQSLLSGTEYTVNIYFDSHGRLRAVVPHRRLSVRAGEVEKGMTERVPQLAALAEQLAAVLPGPRGAMCFQAMVAEDGSASMFEINARFGGGYPLAHHAGATFTRWLLEERLGLAPTVQHGWRAGVMMLRYDAAVFSEP